jgi:hypothetical protein
VTQATDDEYARSKVAWTCGFDSAAFHAESSLSFSNPRAPINGRESAIVTKPNRRLAESSVV